jgi:two-component system osmolarity sensor histidine kinase EnvZ
MLSGVSHDLRTPLTRLKLALTLLKNEDDAKEMLEDVSSMQAMLDEFLIFAKTEAIEETTLLDPIKLIQKIVNRNKKQFQNIEFVIKNNIIAPVSFPLREMIFERTVQNIIDNATSFSSKISINVEINKKFLQILIEDNGPGIELDDRAKALKPFTRLDQSRNQNNHSGVGLGLSIALDTVRSHGGNLILESSQELGGLKVKIKLPL